MSSDSSKQQRPPSVSSWNSAYVEDLYERWLQDPASLSQHWQTFFQGFEMAMCPRACVAGRQAHLQSQVASLIYAYRNLGYMIASLDPLGNNQKHLADLDISEFGFTEADLDQVFDTGHLRGPQRATLRDITEVLRKTYCGSIGIEYIHIQDRKIRRWLQGEMEPIANKPKYEREKQLAILKKLIDAEAFEKFLHTHYPGQKRFSLEGAETFIAAIHELVEQAPEEGVEEIVIGMAHRGRLNVLANILDKSYAMIFEEFEHNILPESFGGDGDVKYHKGFSSDHYNRTGKKLHISLAANPSHLEAVDPVVQGKARAKQRQHRDVDRRQKVLPFLVHGDAAFAGQGLVAEVFNLSQLKGYRTGGTIHFVINNQIGFTTDPTESRSSTHCTDIAKSVQAPIFHVNGDDPEAVVFAVELALRFRQKFGGDVVVDMFCYRRHGHNESDEPAFTQPLMYKKIKNHPSVANIYKNQLLQAGAISKTEANDLAAQFQKQLQKDFEQVTTVEVKPEIHAYEKLWQGLNAPYSHASVATGVTHRQLLQIARALTTVPDGFILNPKIKRHLPLRMRAIEQKDNVDWAYAELLAFGALVAEGNPVRLSGQDSVRGTFSQRHCGWQDMNTMELYIPLLHIHKEQARFCAYNSPLSEAGVLGFDYGYSLAEPHMLIMWEAQFGDFANGAQVIIDQFITCSQSKWQRISGLVMLLPHGYEGQGPEHSNAYLERYLAACAEENIIVSYPSTPAQYFHILRRQLHRPFRRPLIIMTPKSLLRHKHNISPVEELISGTFREILDDPLQPAHPKRLVFCSGKIFYDLHEQRLQENNEDIALVRIEQFYPLHREMLSEIAGKYLPSVQGIIWAQEETKNRGAWSYMQPLLKYFFPDKQLCYMGRGYAASPATGSLKRHQQEQRKIIELVLHGKLGTDDCIIKPEGCE